VWRVIAIVTLAGCTVARERDDAGVADDERVHARGILDPASEAFHGRELARRDWDFALCATCHGDELDGGTSAVSCLSCHVDGPTTCETCHAPASMAGPHLAHLARDVACAECHVVPAAWDDAGHIVGDAAPAEVRLGAMAARDLDPPRRDGPPAYDPATRTCANVYCHGGAFDDDLARAPAPVWTTAGDQASCGGCHGVPPSGHAPAAVEDCVRCHGAAPGAHVDGVVDLGDNSGTCGACHGDASSPAPPRGLHGERFTTAIAVGAHRAHVEAPSGLRGPIACAECHVMPAAVDTPGHVDSAPPAEVILASGTWDREAATCAGTGCHGAATPVWTRVGLGEASCGTCHGVPPPGHDPALGVFDCVTCHPAFDEGQHLDGDVDL